MKHNFSDKKKKCKRIWSVIPTSSPKITKNSYLQRNVNKLTTFITYYPKEKKNYGSNFVFNSFGSLSSANTKDCYHYLDITFLILINSRTYKKFM